LTLTQAWSQPGRVLVSMNTLLPNASGNEEFCQRLAAGGRFVVRYDHRDTGRSVSYPAGAPGYTGADLAADVVGVLDALGR
jgi:pimeloyl-ACP methyl ester carboxylesterase